MRTPRRIRLVLAVIATAASVAALAPRETAAASCAGQSHELVLSDGAVSPRSGSTEVTFAFDVTYADNDGCAPDRIVVVIVGVGEVPLSWIGGDLVTGATFGRRVTLPAGRWRYRFEASSGSGVGRRMVTLSDVDPSAVTVTAPTPRPAAEPSAKPTPEPMPTDTMSPGTDPPSASPSLWPQTPPPAAPSAAVPTDARSATAVQTLTSPVAPTGGGGLPRPILALVVSTLGTLGGLGLFALLGTRLLFAPVAPVAPGRGAAPPPGRDQDAAGSDSRP